MKKLLILLVAFILASGMIYAQEAEDEEERAKRFGVEITLGFPINWSNGLHDDEFITGNPPGAYMPDRTVTANTSFGLAFSFDFNRRLGLALDADLFYGSRLAGSPIIDSEHGSFFGSNVFLGMIIYLVNTDTVKIPLGIGGHMYYFSDESWIGGDEWIKRTDLQVGPGVTLGVQYHFSNNIYVFSRTNIGIPIYRIHGRKGYDGTDYEDEQHTDLGVNWNVKPGLGLGIRF